MKTSGIVALSVGVATLLFGGTIVSGQQANTITIEGYLIDAGGNPIKQGKVLVSPTSGRGRQAKAITDNNGHYNLKIAQGAPVTIMYVAGPGQVSISALSGRHSHVISKLMLVGPVKAAKLPAAQAGRLLFESLQAYEFLLFETRGTGDADFLAFAREEEIMPTNDKLESLARDADSIEDPQVQGLLKSKLAFLRSQYSIKQ